MAAPMTSISSVSKLPHHEKKEFCFTRAKYRQGRKYTAVKVYTITQESYFLLVLNVPAVGVREELEALCLRFGPLQLCHPLDEYESEQFTETYLVKYCRIQAARSAKIQLDERSFFGGTLHVCYAPEFETVQDTQRKLEERRKIVAARLKQMSNPQANYRRPNKKPQHMRKKTIPETMGHQQALLDSGVKSVTYIWAGKEYTVPCIQPSTKPSIDAGTSKTKVVNTSFVPRQLASKGKESRAAALEEDVVLRIRKRVAAVAAANLEVCLKRKRKK